MLGAVETCGKSFGIVGIQPFAADTSECALKLCLWEVMAIGSAYAKAGSSLREFPRIFLSIYPQKPKSAFFMALFSHL